MKDMKWFAEDLKENHWEYLFSDFPAELKGDCGQVFRIDRRACASINKVLSADFRAVYRNVDDWHDQLKAKDLHFDTDDTYIVTATDQLIRLSISEWAFAEVVGK